MKTATKELISATAGAFACLICRFIYSSVEGATWIGIFEYLILAGGLIVALPLLRKKLASQPIPHIPLMYLSFCAGWGIVLKFFYFN